MRTGKQKLLTYLVKIIYDKINMYFMEKQKGKKKVKKKENKKLRKRKKESKRDFYTIQTILRKFLMSILTKIQKTLSPLNTLL